MVLLGWAIANVEQSSANFVQFQKLCTNPTPSTLAAQTSQVASDLASVTLKISTKMELPWDFPSA